MSAAEPSGEQHTTRQRSEVSMDAAAHAQSEQKFDPRDPFTLLCERCGYVIEDLHPDGPCPECGKPITESLHNRTGTPWQQHPSLMNLLRTWWMTIRHPKRTLDTILLHNDQGLHLASAAIFAGAGSASMLVALPLFFDPESFIIMFFIGGIVGTSLSWLVLFTLTAIEAMGLRIIARNRKLRISYQISWSIVGHGCVGWVISAASFLLGIWSFMGYLYWTETLGGSMRDGVGTLLRILIAVFFLGGIPLGFLFFEWFAWMGIKRCKFANHPDAGSSVREQNEPSDQP